LVPSLYVETTFAGAVPSDHLYTVAIGDTTDKPDVAIGRMPVTSVADLQTMVTKTVNWKTWSSATGHISTGAFAAGWEDPTFSTSSDQMAADLPSPFTVQKFYETGDPTTDATNSTNFQAAFSAGPEVVNYMGHGNYERWSNTPLFQVSNVAGLTNGDAPSMVFQWGCQATDYAIPNLPNLNVSMLTSTVASGANAGKPDGAVLEVGSTGADLAPNEELFAGGTAATGPTGVRYFYGYLARNYSVGQAVMYAGRDLMTEFPSDTDYIDVENTYQVLGDPALTLTRTPTASNVSALSATRGGSTVVVHWRASASGLLGFNLYAGHHALNRHLIPARASHTVYAVRVKTSARTIRLEAIDTRGERWWYTMQVHIKPAGSSE
jgi:hypothetical protein